MTDYSLSCNDRFNQRFPKYSTLAKQYHQPIPKLPKIRKPKPKGVSFQELKAKHKPLPDLPEPEDKPDAPLELNHEPDTGKLLFNPSI